MTTTVAVPRPSTEVRRFLRNSALFLLVGLVLYAGVYAAVEHLIDRDGRRNRFHMVKSAPRASYDYVILGASHAAVFDFEDMNARLETMTGATILNLSVVGGGVSVNRLLLDYFLANHHAKAVVYVLDSFVFHSPEWNERRLADARLFQRAPFDPVLARLLLENPSTRWQGVDYVLGFSKINSAARVDPDTRQEETTRFGRTYRPVTQIDQQRINYLFPVQADQARAYRARYLGEFADLLRQARARNLRVVVIKPPIPERVYRMLPNEQEFDVELRAVLDRHGAEFHDFSLVDNAEPFFYDSDHLNRAGVLQFFERRLAPTLGI